MSAFFHNRLLMLVLMLGLGLGFVSAVYAETKPASAEAVEKLQDRVIELEKETAVLKAELGTRIDAQDNRIADGIGQHGAQVTLLSNQTTYLGNLIQWFAMGIAVLGLVGGFFAFLRAEKLAKKRIDEWFESNETALQERIENLGHVAVDALNARSEEIKGLMEQTRQGVLDHADDVHLVLEKARAEIFRGVKPTAEVVHQVERVARDLNAKPRSQWTAADFNNSGVYSYTTGDYETALSRWSTVINLLADSTDIDSRTLVITTLLNKGTLLGRWMKRPEEAVTAYEDGLRRFDEHPVCELVEQVATALVNKGVALGQINRHEESIESYNEVIRRFGESTEIPLREQVAMALLNKGLTLGQMNRPEDALTTYDDLLNRLGNTTALPLQVPLAKALVSKGNTLRQMNLLDNALAVFVEVGRRFDDSKEPALFDVIAKSMFNKGLTLGQMGRLEDALAAYQGIIGHFGGCTELELREWVAKALLNKGYTLRLVNRREDELAAYDDLLNRFSGCSEPVLCALVAKTLANKRLTLIHMGRYKEADDVFNDLTGRFGESTDPELRKVVDMARKNLDGKP